MADIFISYSRDDRSRVQPLAEALINAGYSVWWYRDIAGGSRYRKETASQLTVAKAVLVAWTRLSVASAWVTHEAGAGRDTGRLLPISLDGSAPPLGFRDIQAFDFSDWRPGDEAQLTELCSALERMIGTSGAMRVTADDNDGRPVVQPSVDNTTERKDMELALRQAENRFRLALKNSPVTVFEQDLDLRYTWVDNPKAGFEPHSVFGKTDGELLDAASADLLTAIKREVLETGRPAHREVTIGAPGQAASTFELTVEPRHDPDGKIDGIICSSVDISERKNLEVNLEQALSAANAANEAKSAFIANMSHEIRTPMSTVIGMLEVLLRTPLSEEQRDHVATALDSSRDLLHVLNDVLDASAIEAGRVSIHGLPFSIRELLKEKHAMFGLRAAQKGLSLSTAVAADVPEWLMADERRIRQVMSNLIGNAVKYTDEGSVEVSASFDPERATLRIEVSDTGVGITGEAQRELFQPFVQADATRSRRYDGSGLGLNISRKLVELMGGEIGVASRIGQGSEFWFEIPAPECEAADQGFGDDPIDAAVPSRRILVAEDNAASQRILKALLTAMGHSVTIVDNGASAVAEVASDRYDVVLMDVMMPGMDGATAARRIRELGGRAGGIPIIALTADIVFGRDHRHLVAGMTDYVSKPIDLALLVEALKRASVSHSSDSG